MAKRKDTAPWQILWRIRAEQKPMHHDWMLHSSFHSNEERDRAFDKLNPDSQLIEFKKRYDEKSDTTNHPRTGKS